MLDLFNIAKPQGCDIQTFYGPSQGNISTPQQYSWVKPRGVSHVYMMLIGSGGAPRNGTSGGGSGSVTVWYGAAQNVPDNLIVRVNGGASTSAFNTTVSYYCSSGLVVLLTATGAAGGSGGVAAAATAFAASGFYSATAGQAGSAGNQTPSPTTFLSGGSAGAGYVSATANYGYTSGNGLSVAAMQKGYFQLQPIIVGVGSTTGSDYGGAYYGCGGAASTVNGFGGPGLCLIASW
jgi:hypothetical protein